MKLLTIIGARPQFIKAGTMSRYILQQEGIEEVLVHTGQHYDDKMSDIFFEEPMFNAKASFALTISSSPVASPIIMDAILDTTVGF